MMEQHRHNHDSQRRSMRREVIAQCSVGVIKTTSTCRLFADFFWVVTE
jgi:hypothetical protein